MLNSTSAIVEPQIQFEQKARQMSDNNNVNDNKKQETTKTVPTAVAAYGR